MQKLIEAEFNAHLQSAQKIFSLTAELQKAATLLTQCLEKGGKILICGNGGSAADFFWYFYKW